MEIIETLAPAYVFARRIGAMRGDIDRACIFGWITRDERNELLDCMRAICTDLISLQETRYAPDETIV